MKGIILAAGLGKRLLPFTACTPKALLPIGKDFLISYSIKLLKNDNIDDICIVVSPQHASQFMQALGTGARYGVDLSYQIQEEPKGIAHAIKSCEKWACNHWNITVTLADTVFLPNKKVHFSSWSGATCYSYQVPNPYWCGCVERDDSNKIIDIVEKPGPGYSKSTEILIGLYKYDQTVWDRINRLKPSDRGELEITDLNKSYLASDRLEVEPFPGVWHDAGTDLEAYMKSWEVIK